MRGLTLPSFAIDNAKVGGVKYRCGEGFARISYAYSLRHLEKALKRMEEFINDLQKG